MSAIVFPANSRDEMIQAALRKAFDEKFFEAIEERFAEEPLCILGMGVYGVAIEAIEEPPGLEIKMTLFDNRNHETFSEVSYRVLPMRREILN